MDKIQTLIDDSKNLTIFTLTGVVTLDDILKQVEKYYSGKTTLYAIWDISEADVSNISNEDIANIAEFGLKFAGARRGGKSAFIASEDFGYGISRVFGAVSELKNMPIEISSFRNINDAKKWLGVD